MHETFIEIRFQQKTLERIEQINAIVGEYQALGFTLTLRQLFYQFVSRPALGVENSLRGYKNLGGVVTDGRRAGLIDWDAIEDRTRNVQRLATWLNPAAMIADDATVYREDLWTLQPCRIEVWIEKDALVGVVEAVCREFRVPLFACRGNVSEPEMHAGLYLFYTSPPPFSAIRLAMALVLLVPAD
jgi:hypothetical protein